MSWIVRGNLEGKDRFLASSAAGNGAFYITSKREYAYEFKVEGSAHEWARRYSTRTLPFTAEPVKKESA
jgi:hypothetical protein